MPNNYIFLVVSATESSANLKEELKWPLKQEERECDC